MKPNRRSVEPFELDISEHVRLNLTTPRDIPAFFAMVERNRASFEQWLGWAEKARDETGAGAFIEHYYKRWQRHAALMVNVWYDETMAGNAVYRVIDDVHHYVEIGYVLDEAFRGQGIATAVTRGLMDYAYERLEMHRVVINCASGNLASRAIPERLGFRHEGTSVEARFVRGQYINIEHYAMLKHEWQAQHARTAVSDAPENVK